MVTVIKSGRSISDVIRYNELKVEKGVAQLLHAARFLQEPQMLTWHHKVSRFQKLTSLNQATKVNSLHISINFDPLDRLNRERFVQIAEMYMQGIGFGDQPYLVYQHYDAGHPHLHIVTTNIQRDGSRISLHNIGRNQSQKVRKEIEEKFGLVKAEKKQRMIPSHREKEGKAEYGQDETKAAIERVVNKVMKEYHFNRFLEFNAILQEYSVVADRGSETSRIYKHGGLVYRMLTEKGEKKGVPIKASSLEGKPTLSKLETQYVLNQHNKEKHVQRVKNRIDLSFLGGKPPLLAQVKNALQREGIHLLLVWDSGNKNGEVTYVDHVTKCAFTGSELGRPYDVEGLLERSAQHLSIRREDDSLERGLSQNQQVNELNVPNDLHSLFSALLKEASASTPQELLEESKKRKKKLKH